MTAYRRREFARPERLAVNSIANETRPWLSWDGTTVYFGSTRAGGEGMAEWYVTTREKVTAK